MTPLRQKLVTALTLKRYSHKTHEAYIRAVASLASYYHRSPDRISNPEITAYLLEMYRLRNWSASTLNVAVSGLRFFYACCGRGCLPMPPALNLPPHHWKTLNALLRCHTPELGGHLYRCGDCGKEHFIAHSCRNRHCPCCQHQAAEAWLQKQGESLLPVPYFHVVFTLPHALNPLIRQNRRALYKLLFDSASATLLTFGHNRFQADIGVTAVLHTWGQTLVDHYHLHCVVTGGGLTRDDPQWRSFSGSYLFPVKALSKVFRGKFRDGLKNLHAKGRLRFHGLLAPLADKEPFQTLLTSAFAQPWVVYSKKPFAGPRAVLAYLSRYTHRVAIGNGRLLALDRGAGTVSFRYKDYAARGRRKQMTLTLREFLRRFCLHILPERLVKIRHYGLLGNRNRTEKIALARARLADPTPGQSSPPAPAPAPTASGPAPLRCPHCGSVNLIFVERRERREPARDPPELADSS